MRSWLLVVLGILVSGLLVTAVIYNTHTHIRSASLETKSSDHPFQVAASQSSPSPSGASSPPSSSSTAQPMGENPSPSASPSGLLPDLSMDANGLSKTTVVLNTTQGSIKFKFYPGDAPKTVKRIAELIGKGFYNGLSFHRVIPGFIIQGGDPTGTGTGGSGQKLEAEFNQRRHGEGTVAMARALDVNSADSQFYISLGVHPHLDHNYTVFGQVIEGMDVVRKIKVGDKMISVNFQ